jgi:hypothetical protein
MKKMKAQCDVNIQDRVEYNVLAPDWAVGTTAHCKRSRCRCSITIEAADRGTLYTYPQGFWNYRGYEQFGFPCPNCKEPVWTEHYYPQQKTKSWLRRALQL